MAAGDPKGFRTAVANAGVKDASDDLVCIVSEAPCLVDAVFTQSRFAGPCIELSRHNAADGSARAVIVVSKNANVANGPAGREDAERLLGTGAAALGVPESEILLAGTGVIGKRWPLDRILPRAAEFGRAQEADFEAAARGIMTTDTAPKVARAAVGGASLVGIAKGVGMIEPNMATLLVFLFTDAHLPRPELSRAFRAAVDVTFNSMSIDTDTSTSDTAAIMANGLAGEVPPEAFATAVEEVCRELMLAILRDGEGATKVIAVRVLGAADREQARAVGKLVVNSPLVKTAVHGADPNWGRIAMAVGKAEEYSEISPERLRIGLAGRCVYPDLVEEAELDLLAQRIAAADEAEIEVDLGIGDAEATVFGCDLSEEYVTLNAEYTT